MEHAAAPPADLPRAPGLRDRWRAFGVRVRHRGRVRLGRGVVLGRGVRFDVPAGGRVVVDDGVALGDGCRLHVRGGAVSIGTGARLGARCALVCHHEVDIGPGCLLGDEVVLGDFDHRFDDVERPVREQGVRVAPVVLGEGVRIGPGAAVLPGVTIGPGAIVGSHAVVVRDVPAAAVVEGVPAAQPSARSSRSRR